MQILLGSTIDDDAPETIEDPAATLLMNYSLDRFKYRTIPIKFNATINDMTHKFNTIQAHLARKFMGDVTATMEVST